MGEVDSKILKLLSKNKAGITINEVASGINMDRHTAAKNLEVLKSQGLINYKEFGKSKLWTISKSPFITALESSDDTPIIRNFKEVLRAVSDDVNIQSKDLHTIWSNRQIDNSMKCYERVGLHEKCKNCPIEKTFRTGRSESQFVNLRNENVEIVTKPIKDDNNNIIAVVEIIKRDFEKRIK